MFVWALAKQQESLKRTWSPTNFPPVINYARRFNMGLCRGEAWVHRCVAICANITWIWIFGWLKVNLSCDHFALLCLCCSIKGTLQSFILAPNALSMCIFESYLPWNLLIIVTIKLPDIVGRNATGTFETHIASKVKMMPILNSRCESTLWQSVRKYHCHCRNKPRELKRSITD